MAAIDKAQRHLADVLVPGEELRDARQLLTPGSMKSFGLAGSVGVMGLVGSYAFQATGGRTAPDPEHLDPARRIDLAPVNLGVLAHSDRRLFLVPPNPKKLADLVELPLQGMATAVYDHGWLFLAVRDLLVVAADGRWAVIELSTGYGRRKKVQQLTDGLSAAIAAYG